jgi:hypothetical protein
MQEIKQNQPIPEANRFSWYASLGVAGLTLLSIFGLFIYQYFQTSHIESLNTEITQLDVNIQTAAMDKDIIIANILSSTVLRPSIDLKLLVRSFRLAAATAGVRLSGFSVSNDMITTNLSVMQESPSIDPVETIIALMRINTPTPDLSLEPIYTLQGSPKERSTAVSFRILSPKTSTNAK